MTREVVIDIAKQFSRTPGGRYIREGKYSGEEFRKSMLEPVLEEGAVVTVDLDGPIGFTTSFLEEVFGGVIRRFGPDIAPRIIPRADTKPSRAKKALGFIERAISLKEWDTR